jgi:putative membrane protein
MDNDSRMKNRTVFFLSLALPVAAVFVWSAIGPHLGYLNWSLESFPVLFVSVALVATGRRFPLTSLLYTFIALHAVILLVGAHYSYAEVPLFNWLRDTFQLSRNHYDRVGHLAQGFVPALAAREVLLRTSPLRPGKWLFFLVCCFCLAVSACYEFIEWWTALVVSQDSADAFLGGQGDVWDTQWDMFMALVGSILSQTFLARRHLNELRQSGLWKPRESGSGLHS